MPEGGRILQLERQRAQLPPLADAYRDANSHLQLAMDDRGADLVRELAEFCPPVSPGWTVHTPRGCARVPQAASLTLVGADGSFLCGYASPRRGHRSPEQALSPVPGKRAALNVELAYLRAVGL